MRGGQVADMFTWFFFMVFLSMFMLSLYLVWTHTNDAFQESSAIPDETKAFFGGQRGVFVNGADSIFLSIFIAVVVGVLILSYFLQSTPLLFWPIWLVLMTLSIAAGYWSNAYDTVTSTPLLSTAATIFPSMNFLMSNYLHVTLVVGLLMILVYFAKPSGGSVTL